MAAPLLLMAPPPPPLLQVGLNTLIYRNMLDITIADGSHDALHSLVNIERRGAFGSAAMHNIETEWTAGARARAKARYAENHFTDALRAQGWASATVMKACPWGTSTATREAVAGCALCFRYLCQKKVIKPEGFFPTRKSFLLEAAAAGNSRLVQYIIDEMPEHLLFEDQDILGLTAAGAVEGTFSVVNTCSKFETPFRKLVARIQEFEQSSPSRFSNLVSRSVGLSLSWLGGEMVLTEASGLEIYKWIDVELAKQLFLWGMHPGKWHSNALASAQSIYSQMLEFQNPNRCAMFRWLDEEPPIGIGIQGVRTVNIPAIPIGLGIPDYYPPWGIAMWMGDVAAAVTLSRLRHIDPVHYGVPGPAQPIGLTANYLPGRAAVEQFDQNHLRLLTHWLRCAAWDLEREDMIFEIMVILENLLDCIETRRAALKAAAVPAGANVRAFRAANKRKVKEETDIAICMIRVIIGIPFRFLEGNEGGVPARRSSITEEEDYRTWIMEVKQNKRELGLYRDCVPILAALERPPDKKVLRSLSEQVMDWE